jgi:hypothetical protein
MNKYLTTLIALLNWFMFFSDIYVGMDTTVTAIWGAASVAWSFAAYQQWRKV